MSRVKFFLQHEKQRIRLEINRAYLTGEKLDNLLEFGGDQVGVAMTR